MKKILIAEDDSKIAAALEIRLTAAGYQVQVIPDGFRSYIRAATDQPDLILMDIYMPMGSGLAVAQELKLAGLADIPIIFMTASKQQDLRDRAEELNAVCFLEKPFDPAKLLAAVAQSLNSSPPAPGIKPPASSTPNKHIKK